MADLDLGLEVSSWTNAAYETPSPPRASDARRQRRLDNRQTTAPGLWLSFPFERAGSHLGPNLGPPPVRGPSTAAPRANRHDKNKKKNESKSENPRARNRRSTAAIYVIQGCVIRQAGETRTRSRACRHRRRREPRETPRWLGGGVSARVRVHLAPRSLPEFSSSSSFRSRDSLE
ncbi:hypothetical protein LZ30DRAFT_296800 [Colletotrichum cereale]|nr:hypothetical protein LZ30DRAFT_296800 [Colletotrichum cereale]